MNNFSHQVQLLNCLWTAGYMAYPEIFAKTKLHLHFSDVEVVVLKKLKLFHSERF